MRAGAIFGVTAKAKARSRACARPGTRTENGSSSAEAFGSPLRVAQDRASPVGVARNCPQVQASDDDKLVFREEADLSWLADACWPQLMLAPTGALETPEASVPMKPISAREPSAGVASWSLETSGSTASHPDDTKRPSRMRNRKIFPARSCLVAIWDPLTMIGLRGENRQILDGETSPGAVPRLIERLAYLIGQRLKAEDRVCRLKRIYTWTTPCGADSR